jgi:hypothetical protein
LLARRELEKELDEMEKTEFTEEWEAFSESLVSVPKQGWVTRDSMSKQALAKQLKAEYEAIIAATQSKQQSNQKLEAKLNILHQGYVNRSNLLNKGIAESYELWSQATIGQKCFTDMYEQESRGIPLRLAKLEAEVEEVAEKEETLQRRYADALSDLRNARNE